MKYGLKIAVLAACMLPVAANAALVYTPPQAMVLTCNGTAPSVTHKTSALATFACANGQTPQAVGVTSGLGDMLGLATGAMALISSESVPSLALPGSVQRLSGIPQSGNGSGNGSSGANSSGNGSGNGSSGTSPNGGGKGSNTGGNTAGNGSGNSGASTNGGGTGSNAGSSSGNAGAGSSATSAGQVAEHAASSGGGGFFGHLINTIGQAAGQIGHAMLHGGTVNIPLLNTGGGNSAGNGSVGVAHTSTSGKSTGAPQNTPQNLPGTITLHNIPAAGVRIPQKSLDALYNWITANHTAGNYLNYIVSPAKVTPVVVPVSGGVYEYAKVTGTFNVYVDNGGHHATQFSGDPVAFTTTVTLSSLGTSAQIAEQKIMASSNGIYSGSPQHWNPPGDRSGPFWPSPQDGGKRMHLVPGQDRNTTLGTAGEGACTLIENTFHTSFGTQCWIDQFPSGTPTNLFPKYNH